MTSGSEAKADLPVIRLSSSLALSRSSALARRRAWLHRGRRSRDTEPTCDDAPVADAGCGTPRPGAGRPPCRRTSSARPPGPRSPVTSSAAPQPRRIAAGMDHKVGIAGQSLRPARTSRPAARSRPRRSFAQKIRQRDLGTGEPPPAARRAEGSRRRLAPMTWMRSPVLGRPEPLTWHRVRSPCWPRAPHGRGADPSGSGATPVTGTT